MDLRRPRPGDWATAAASAVLLGSLFLPWYAGGGECARAPCPTEATGWQALAAIDVALAVAAALGLAAFLATLAERTEAAAVVLTSLAALAAVAARYALDVDPASVPALAGRHGLDLGG